MDVPEHGPPPDPPVAASEAPLEKDDQVETEQEKNLLEEIWCLRKAPDDWKDESFDPSYSKFEVPYNMKCRDRYHRSKHLYEHQFLYEINQIINQLNSAFEAARLVRVGGLKIGMWCFLVKRTRPAFDVMTTRPLRVTSTQRYYFRMTPKQQQRLRYIMSTNFQ